MSRKIEVDSEVLEFLLGEHMRCEYQYNRDAKSNVRKDLEERFDCGCDFGNDVYEAAGKYHDYMEDEFLVEMYDTNTVCKNAAIDFYENTVSINIEFKGYLVKISSKGEEWQYKGSDKVVDRAPVDLPPYEQYIIDNIRRQIEWKK